MARLQAHEIAYDLETKVASRLRSLKVARAGSIAKDLTPTLMESIPTEAYDAKPIWEMGYLFFTGEVTEDYVREMQEDILGTHHNIKPGIPITIYLSSIGGDAFAGMALFSVIQEVRRAGRRVRCHISGVAMSMGSLLAQACDERLVEPYAFFMLHEVYDGFDAKTSDAEDRVNFNKKLENALFGFYAMRSGKPVDYWREKFARKDWYIGAYEAVREGLADRVVPLPKFQRRERKKKKEPGAE